MRYAISILFLLSVPVLAQTTGTCERGVAEGDLNADGSEVFARVYNTGALFFRNALLENGYVVPRENGNSPVHATSLWVGGKVNGSIRIAGARFTRFEFWPGPLGDGAVLPSPADCTAYDRIFVVSRSDVARYLQTGDANDDLLDWPVDWGAPVLDGDGIEGNYNLEGGDQPAIFGEQTAWWVMNDVGNVHEETLSDPLGVEVQVSAFAAGSGVRALRQATYYRYTIFNRSPNTIDSAYVSLFSQASLIWVGTDTTLSMGFVYNGDNRQDESIHPALGFQVIQGPVGLPNGRDDDGDGEVDESGEQMGLTRMTHWCGSCVQSGTSDPRFAVEYYNHMRGRWKDGTPFTEAGHGYETDGPETLFVYAGDPVTNQCWSHANDCLGGIVSSWRGNIVVHTGPFYLGPGESTEVVFAIPFAQGTSNLDSVTQLRKAAHVVKAAWDTGFLAPQRVEVEPLPESFQLQISPPFPNPFTDQTAIRYELPEAMFVRMVVYDALGREVAVLVDGEHLAGSYEAVFDGTGLAPGTYIVRFEAAGEERSFSVVKLR